MFSAMRVSILSMKYEWIEFWDYANFACLIQYVEGVIRDFGDKYKIHFE